MGIKKEGLRSLSIIGFLESGRQDSNLRPSAPKALISSCAALGFQAIPNYLLGSAKFVVTNKVIFVRNLSAKYLL